MNRKLITLIPTLIAINSSFGQLTSSITDSTNISCNGLCDGIAIVTPSGGSPPYTYSWKTTPVQTDSTATGLCAGVIDTVIVTDAALAVDTTYVTLSEPAVLIITVDSTKDVSCFGGSSGIIYSRASGGTPPYQFSIDGGGSFQPDSAFSGLPAGTDSIIVRDANLCTDTVFGIIISQPLALVITVDSTKDVSCFGGSNGIIYSRASGGTTPYQFSIDGGGSFQPDSAFSGLPAGTDSVIVRDANLCTDTVFGIIISQPLALVITVDSTKDVSCFGGSNGIIYSRASGGTTPYQFSIDGGGSFQPDSAFSGLPAGTDSVIVRDANLCTDTVFSIIIFQPTVLVITLDSTKNVSCFGGSNGIIYTSASGGTPPYQFSINGGGSFQSDSTFSGLPAGTDSVIVRDANLCSDTVFGIIISEPALLVISVDSIIDVLGCFGDSTGIIYTSATGGTLPYQFSIDGGASYQPGGTFSGLPAGTDSVIVRDANLCSDTVFGLFISQPPVLIITVDSTKNVNCNGGSDGIVYTSASGGTLPYQFSIDNGFSYQPDSAFIGLPAGNYCIIVRDTNLCTDTICQIISEPAVLTTSITDTTHLLCGGICTGNATVTPVGGTSPYTYLWKNAFGDTTSTDTIAAGLCAGDHRVIVTDANNCVDSSDVTLTEPLPFTSGIQVDDSSKISCYGFCDGTPIVSPSGGVLPYTYLWDDPDSQTTPTATGLCAGSYQVIVNDNNGCADTSYVTLANPPLLTSAITDSSYITCSGLCDGSATLTTSGGTLPYTYLWTGGETTPVAVSLCAGLNSVIVTDSSACKDTSAITLIASNPTPLAVFTVSEVCLGDTTVFTNSSTISSGTISFNWDFGDGFGSSTLTNPKYIYTYADTFSVRLIVKSNQDCYDTAFVNAIVNPLPVANITAAGVLAFCSGDSLELLADPAANYLWLRDGDTIPGAVDSFYYANINGDYQVLVTNNCGSAVSPVVNVTVYPKPIADAGIDTIVSFGRSITLNGQGGLNYYWSPGIYLSDSTIANPVATPLAPVSYILTVTGINGCADADSVNITIEVDYDFIVSNLMTPNEDGDNDIWYIDNIESYPECEVSVFNRYGFMLYSKSPYDNDWDGKYNGSKLPDGTYYYVLSCDKKVFKGIITILSNE